MYLIGQIAIGILLGRTLIVLAEDLGKLMLKWTSKFLRCTKAPDGGSCGKCWKCGS